MATASPLRKLVDEVLCSICLDYLKDPVTIDCGHVFCCHCIIKVCESAQQPLYCSLCKTAFKEENIHAERQPREDRPLEQRAEQLCRQHLEKLHYYCKDDQQILCVLCRESREHRHHPAVLLEKAAQPYRVRSLLDPREDEIQTLLVRENHRQDIASVFERGHQFLREREQYLLEWLEGTEQQLTEGRNSHVTKGSEEVIRLETLISELEKKAQQPALELLQVRDQLNCTQVLLLQALVMPSNHLNLCRPLLLLPSIFPSIRVFSNESVLHIRWSEYWSFSFSISPSNEYSGLISFRMDWFDLAVQGTLKSVR
uniref:Uncharacterized protein n=1 Tax=Moschus moschiferus TaxID=68415 RepID=A0A8C6D1C3_MOSMO